MRKLALALATVAAIGLASAPAVFAAEDCNSTMTKIESQISKATDYKKKDAASAELKLAKDAQAKKDDKACVSHLKAAEKALK